MEREREVAARVSVEVGQPSRRPPCDQQQLERPGRPERHERQPRVALGHDPGAARLLLDVVEQHPATGQRRMVGLCGRLSSGDRREARFLPRSGRAGAGSTPHRRAAVLEHLDPAIASAELIGLVGPQVDDPTDVAGRHRRQRQVVPRRETHDATFAVLALGPDEPLRELPYPGVRPERAEIVGEYERRVIARVHVAVGPHVARAQVAARVVGGSLGGSIGLRRPEPRSLRPVGCNEHPFVEQRVVAAMRIEREVDPRRSPSTAPVSWRHRASPEPDEAPR
jgi:hypothetical protein